jgi:leader peptidase (prepilin peptidase)/N-methyltransferase
MTVLLAILFTLLGISVGSFLNVCIDRMPARRSLFSPGSACDECQHKLTITELVPVISYFWLRGRCRYCGARIPLRVPLVEVLAGGLFLLAYWRFGLSAEFGVTAFWCSVFLVIIFIDWENQLILNRITYPAMIVALIILGIDSLLSNPGILRNIDFTPDISILSGLAGGGAGFLFFTMVFVISRGGMGMGDIKLALLIGLVVGFPLVVIALLTGIVTGGLVAVVLLSFKLRGRKDAIPYGTFLGIGPIITLLWGNEILGWYLGLF